MLERGLHSAGGLWELPQKIFKIKVANTPKFNDFLQLPKKFWMSKYLLLMTEVPDLLQAGIPRDGLQCIEHLKYMGTACGGAVVLNDWKSLDCLRKGAVKKIAPTQKTKKKLMP